MAASISQLLDDGSRQIQVWITRGDKRNKRLFVSSPEAFKKLIDC
jgi:hypothetical protein